MATLKVECLRRPEPEDADDYAVIGVIDTETNSRWDVVLDSQDLIGLMNAVDFEAGSWYLIEALD